MRPRPPYMENPDKMAIATEVLNSAVRVLQAAGFYDDEVQQLFQQIASKRARVPVWLKAPDPHADAPAQA